MYNDILYTLSVPQKDSRIQGVSKSTHKLVVTCVLSSVRALGMVKDSQAYRCRSQHGAVYLIYVLPPEANMGRAFRHEYDVLNKQPAPPVHICRYPGCTGYSHQLAYHPSANALGQIRWLLILLAILSVLLGSNVELGAKLWSLFLSMFRLFIPL